MAQQFSQSGAAGGGRGGGGGGRGRRRNRDTPRGPGDAGVEQPAAHRQRQGQEGNTNMNWQQEAMMGGAPGGGGGGGAGGGKKKRNRGGKGGGRGGGGPADPMDISNAPSSVSPAGGMASFAFGAPGAGAFGGALPGFDGFGQQQQQQQQQQQAAAHHVAGGHDLRGAGAGGGIAAPISVRPVVEQTFISKSRFADLDVSDLTKRGVRDMGFEFMTRVQEASITPILEGKDVLGKAKTGTGKTVAFLIPALEQLAFRPPTPGTISVLVIAPTRELASQIETQALALTKYHPFGVQCVYGGTNMKTDLSRLRNKRCDILVATPGRLQDHIDNEGLKFTHLRSFILDEADQLLEMGFRPAIEKIIRSLPKERQTLCFSATMPSDLQRILSIALKKDFVTVDTVGKEVNSNVQVRQGSMITKLEDQIDTILALVEGHARTTPNFKILVFFVTARATGFMSELFNKLGIKVMEIHSRKSQSHRNKCSEEFRSSANVIMFTSDVSARGVDYPDVTFVLQVGCPSDRQQYIHRLGRTARAGREGEGLILLSDFERGFLDSVKDLPIKPHPQPAPDATRRERVERGLAMMDAQTGAQAYQAWLGFYNSCKVVKWDKPTLVQWANFYSQTIGLKELPGLLKKTVGMMGLRGVPGLNVVSELPGRPGGGGGRGGGGGGGRGGGRGGGGGGGGRGGGFGGR